MKKEKLNELKEKGKKALEKVKDDAQEKINKLKRTKNNNAG